MLLSYSSFLLFLTYKYLLSVSVVALILQFDGSLRPVKDPYEYPQLVPSYISSSCLPLTASCSSVLFTDGVDDDNVQERDILWIGSRELVPQHRNHEQNKRGGCREEKEDTFESSTDCRITSATVEYEALILGLNGLIRYFDMKDSSIIALLPDNVGDQSASSQPTPVSPIKREEEHCIIIVRGDCKTVIDQMNGISLPRKQRRYFVQAKELLEKIEHKWNVHFVFEHVPRDQNILCDYICYKVAQMIQWRAVLDMKRSIKNVANEMMDPSFEMVKLPSSKKETNEVGPIKICKSCTDTK
uniref:RNase H type-1 domain-containing protein n=1 Tax=Ditylum brightwellii TaxID=49249 RepID=A0A7S4T3B0_9STRA